MTIKSLRTIGLSAFPITEGATAPAASEPCWAWSSTLSRPMYWTGTFWTGLGGRATGGHTDRVFYLNDKTINNDFTIPDGQNAGSFGPITVATGKTVTVGTGSTWSIPSAGGGSIPDGTVTQADLAPNVVGNGPVFKAYQSVAQTLPAAYTKVNLQSKAFDSGNFFNTTLSRFTPTVAGYYQINATLLNNNGGQHALAIYKNGAVELYGNNIVGSGFVVGGMLYLNGTTDYIELYCYGAGTAIVAGIGATFMSGCLVRAA